MIENEINDSLKEERVLNEKLFASKVVEWIVFGFTGLALVAVAGLILKAAGLGV